MAYKHAYRRTNKSSTLLRTVEPALSGHHRGMAK